MTVTLSVEKTINGAAISDTLRGSDTGYDMGQSQTGQIAPTAAFYLSHNGTNLITQLCVNVQSYSGTYGGDYSAGADLTKLIADGDATFGLQIDFDAFSGSPFGGTFTTLKSATGVTYATRIQFPTGAFCYNNSGAAGTPSARVAGSLGASGDHTLGDRVHFSARYMVTGSETQLGYRQFDLFFAFNFTT